ncbi:MAG: hypothetical protein ACT4QC_05605 [Planctomycetaceae bacterium]
MSLWISYRDKDGRIKVMSITISLLGIIMVLITLALPVIHWLRLWWQ